MYQFKRENFPGIDFTDSPSMTEQSHKDDCDIHVIMKRYKKTGMVTHTNQYQGTYGDFIDAPDFQDAQNYIADASAMFLTIPSGIRDQFNNNPAEFLDFIQNEENREAMEELGFSSSHLPSKQEKNSPPSDGEKPKKPPKAASEPSNDPSDNG